MCENETTPPLNEAELEALDGVLGESETVTSDQVAGVIQENMVDTDCQNYIRAACTDDLADLYAAADPTFDRDEFLRRCGL